MADVGYQLAIFYNKARYTQWRYWGWFHLSIPQTFNLQFVLSARCAAVKVEQNLFVGVVNQ